MKRLALLVLIVALLVTIIPAATAFGQPAQGKQCRAVYVVKRGDMLSRIAAYYGVSTKTLQQVNHINNRNVIYVGQRICIPGYPPPKPPPPPNHHTKAILATTHHQPIPVTADNHYHPITPNHAYPAIPMATIHHHPTPVTDTQLRHARFLPRMVSAMSGTTTTTFNNASVAPQSKRWDWMLLNSNSRMPML